MENSRLLSWLKEIDIELDVGNFDASLMSERLYILGDLAKLHKSKSLDVAQKLKSYGQWRGMTILHFSMGC